MGGGHLLLSWLLEENPELEDVTDRQEAVKELCSLSGFRSRLVLSSSLVSAGGDEAWDGEQLLSWLRWHAESKSLRPLLIVLSVLAAANLLLFVLFLLNVLPAIWFVTLAI